MEPTPFNLEHAIDQYIIRVSNQGSITHADAMELTAHLYDATADLQQNNLTEEEAFLLASKRLGNVYVLTQEYSKVNPSIQASKVWAYLFIGFNLFYAIPSLVLMAITGVYYAIYSYFKYASAAYILATLFHVLFIAVVWFIIKKKNNISQFIERQVSSNSLRITLISFLPLLISFMVNFQFRRLSIDNYLYYPMREWNSSIVEVTYYMAILSIFSAVLSLVFSVGNSNRLTFKSLFEKPSYLFLICFGILVQLSAASTRVSGTRSIVVAAIFFGLIYLIGAFLISYYNKTRASFKYVLVFAAFGFIVDTSACIRNDLDRGNFYFTTCFVSATLICTFLGWLLGQKYGKVNLSPQSV